MKNGAPFQLNQHHPDPHKAKGPQPQATIPQKRGIPQYLKGNLVFWEVVLELAPGAARPSQGPHKNSEQVRPSNSERGGQPQKPAKPGHLSRPGSNGLVRPSSGDPSKQPRPGGSLQGQQAPGSSKASINGPSRMGGSVSGRDR